MTYCNFGPEREKYPQVSNGGGHLLDYLEAVKLLRPDVLLNMIPSDGISADQLVRNLQQDGYDASKVLVVLSSLLDSGEIELGARMKLMKTQL